MFTIKRNVDPELEKLRKEVDGPPNLDTLILNIQKDTAHIHASCLFETNGLPILHTLCLLLSSTASGKAYSGWQEFAVHMGLTIEQIGCIEHNFKAEDSTFYVMLAYVEHENATVDKILCALQNIHRFDIINQIKDNILNLINEIKQNNTITGSTIVRTKNIPKAPFVLRSLKAIKNIEQERNNPEYTTHENSQKIKQKYGTRVMLTFTDDGLTIAQEIAKIFRSKTPRIGVVVLEEHENYVYNMAEEFVDSCFRQVDFIIPILTPRYIEEIDNPRKTYIENQNKLDAKYVRYIYTLLRNEYAMNQCVNYRVRCIVPDEEVYTVVCTNPNLHPTLQAWFRKSEIERFVKNILLQKCSR